MRSNNKLEVNMDRVLCHVLSTNNFSDRKVVAKHGGAMKKRSRRGKRMGKRHGSSVKKLHSLIPREVTVITAICPVCACEIVVPERHLGHQLCQRCERLFPDQVHEGSLMDKCAFDHFTNSTCSTPITEESILHAPINCLFSNLALDLCQIGRDPGNSSGSETSLSFSESVDIEQSSDDESSHSFETFVKQNFEEEYRSCLDDHLQAMPKHRLISNIATMIKTADYLEVAGETNERQDLLKQILSLKSENKKLIDENHHLRVSRL